MAPRPARRVMGVVGVGAQLARDGLNLVGVEAVDQDAEGLRVRSELEGARFLSADDFDVAGLRVFGLGEG